MVPSSTSGSSAWANIELMSGGCPAGPVAAACVALASSDDPQAASTNPPASAAARITAATATATSGLRISHLFIVFCCFLRRRVWQARLGDRWAVAERWL